MDFLNAEAFAGLRWLEVVAIVGGLVVLMYVWSMLTSSKRGRGAATIKGTCPSCGWSGQVSMHTRRCPKCNGTITV